jgi:hypothetical protein
MLASVGIESEPVLVNSGSRYHLPPVALTYPFNHIISYLPSLKIYLDPTAHFTPFGFLPFEVADKPVVHGHTGRVARTPAYSSETNYSRSMIRLRLDERGSIDGEVRVRVSGSYESASRGLAFERLHTDPGTVAEKIFATHREAGVGRISNSDPRDMATAFQLGSKFQIESHVSLPGPGAFPVPVGLSPALLQDMAIRKPLDSRSRPFACEPELIEEVMSLDLGNHLAIKRVPQGRSYEGGPIRYVSNYRLQKSPSGVVLLIKRRLEISSASHVCAEDTQAYFSDLFRVLREDLRQLIFHG